MRGPLDLEDLLFLRLTPAIDVADVLVGRLLEDVKLAVRLVRADGAVALLLLEMVGRIAPVSPHMILCFIAERVLGLPKSY